MPAPGQRVHAAYRHQFRHRYGGHSPSWSAISRAEQGLWAEVELELVRELAARWFMVEDALTTGNGEGQTPSH